MREEKGRKGEGTHQQVFWPSSFSPDTSQAQLLGNCAGLIKWTTFIPWSHMIPCAWRIGSYCLNTFSEGDGEGNGNPLQCSCLENPRDGGACRAAVYGVAQSRHDWSDLAAAAAAAAAAVKVMGLGCRFITPGALHSIGVWEAILPPGNPFDSQWPISLCLASGVLLCLVSEWSSLSRVQLFANPWTKQSMEFSRLEYWSG